MAQKYKLTEEQRKLLSRKNIRLEKKDQKQYDEWLYLQMLACAKRYFDPKLDNYDKSIPMEYRILFTILERGLTQEYTDENGDTKMRFLWKTKDDSTDKKDILLGAKMSSKGALTFNIKRPLKNFVEEKNPDPNKKDYDIKNGKVGHYEYIYQDDDIIIDKRAYKNYYKHFEDFINEQKEKEENENVRNKEKSC